ncbi:hypothetical protein R1sor_011993 [Riccia sorocarpa]|uniref:Endonuclease/exonuclease/phosphatase domain-containing protein n=1 Tax=Riccia sorocarpa TaxID=122646 RepID=A0ABD3I6G5_9MARC
MSSSGETGPSGSSSVTIFDMLIQQLANLEMVTDREESVVHFQPDKSFITDLLKLSATAVYSYYFEGEITLDGVVLRSVREVKRHVYFDLYEMLLIGNRMPIFKAQGLKTVSVRHVWQFAFVTAFETEKQKDEALEVEVANIRSSTVAHFTWTVECENIAFKPLERPIWLQLSGIPTWLKKSVPGIFKSAGDHTEDTGLAANTWKGDAKPTLHRHRKRNATNAMVLSEDRLAQDSGEGGEIGEQPLSDSAGRNHEVETSAAEDVLSQPVREQPIHDVSSTLEEIIRNLPGETSYQNAGSTSMIIEVPISVEYTRGRGHLSELARFVNRGNQPSLPVLPAVRSVDDDLTEVQPSKKRSRVEEGVSDRIHAPNDPAERANFWELVEETLPDLLFLLLGDFNNLELHEDSSSWANHMGMEEGVAFSRLCGALSLFDSRWLVDTIIGPRWTRYERRNGVYSWARLDRIYAQLDQFQGQFAASVHHVVFQLSDHLPVSLLIRDPPETQEVHRSLYFKADVSLLKRPYFQRDLSDIWDRRYSELESLNDLERFVLTWNHFRQEVKNRQYVEVSKLSQLEELRRELQQAADNQLQAVINPERVFELTGEVARLEA